MPYSPKTLRQKLKDRDGVADTRMYDHQRGSASARGYDAKWRKFRKWFLSRHPLCTDCTGTRSATEVHHIQKLVDAPQLKCVEDNCMALCHSCHSVRTGKGE
jgi:5-methylcytosine-specific restriction protein A